MGMKGLVKTVSYADKFAGKKMPIKKSDPSNPSPRNIVIVNDIKTSSNQHLRKCLTPKQSSTPLESWSQSDLSQSEAGDREDDLEAEATLDTDIDSPLIDPDSIQRSSEKKLHSQQNSQIQTERETPPLYRHPAFNPQLNSKHETKNITTKSKVEENRTKNTNPTEHHSSTKTTLTSEISNINYGDVLKPKPLPQLPAVTFNVEAIARNTHPEQLVSPSASSTESSSSDSSFVDNPIKNSYDTAHHVKSSIEVQRVKHGHRHKDLDVAMVETEIQLLEQEIGLHHESTCSKDHHLPQRMSAASRIEHINKGIQSNNEYDGSRGSGGCVGKPRRRVEYTPYSLEEYRLTKPRGYVEITPKLRPDLNSDELLAKRANMQRIKDFAKQLKQFNKMTQDPTKRTLEVEKARQVEIAQKFQESKLAKATEFAKKVPKPKRVPNEVITMQDVGPTKTYQHTSGHKQLVPPNDEDFCTTSQRLSVSEPSSKQKEIHSCSHSPSRLEQLESKYRETQRQVEFIKQSFRHSS